LKSYRHGADGGDYDGCLGSISGLEIMEILNIVTRHPLELIIFSDEEGSLLGSKALGAFNKERLKMLSQSGLTVGEGIDAIGGKVDIKCDEKKGDLLAF
jgi:N-carbamoyl-L-amino-acid hydrolase